MRRGSDCDREAAKDSKAEAVQGWAEAQFVATLSSALPQSSHSHTYTHTLAYTVVHKESKRKRATHKRQKSNLRCSDKSSKPACCSAAAALLLPSLTVYLVR